MFRDEVYVAEDKTLFLRAGWSLREGVGADGVQIKCRNLTCLRRDCVVWFNVKLILLHVSDVSLKHYA